VTRALAEVCTLDGASALADAQAAVALGQELQGDRQDSARTGKALVALGKAQEKLGLHDAARASLAQAVRQLSHTVEESNLWLIEARALQRDHPATGG
jgi:hypothetical protein